jgi:iron(III) transport system ATP-binding protein
MAVRVCIDNLTKHYGDVVALDRVSIDVAPGEFFFLIGPSGCGKTTLLRAIAGFVKPDAGTIRFDDRDVGGEPPHRRNTALVFQGYALWPHMTVRQNVDYGLRVRRTPAAERRRRVDDILDVVRLSALAGRYPGELSGGQQQRVALARAIVVNPDVLLLDEPLSNLDARLRVEMRRELLRIHEQTGITTIYVTHDQKEALSMGQRIAILNEGRIVQVGAPQACYRRPRTRFVAEFLGDTNFVEGTVAAIRRDGLCELETPLGILCVERPETDAQGTEPIEPGQAIGAHGPPPVVGQRVTCCFRPESLRLVKPGVANAPNRFRARVVRSTYLGEMYELDVRAAGLELSAMIIGAREPVAAASEIELSVAASEIVLL